MSNETVLSQFGITDEILVIDGDQSIITKGGSFTSLLNNVDNFGNPSIGKCYLRFIGYTQYGVHTVGKGAQQKTKDMHLLEFEVVSKRHITVKEVDGVDKQYSESIMIRLKEGSNSKSAFMNYFTRMTYGRDNIKHMAQMLGEGFQATISNTEYEGKTYARIHDGEAGEYTIGRAVDQDPDTGQEVVRQVSEPLNSLSCFLWKQPNKGMWDSLQIGDHADDAKENWKKHLVLKAENYAGSPIEQYLMSSGIVLNIPLPDDEPEQSEPEVETPPVKQEASKADTTVGIVTVTDTTPIDTAAALAML
jgi:hypothetical protein